MVTLADTKGAFFGEVITGKHRDDQFGAGIGGVYVRKRVRPSHGSRAATSILPAIRPTGW